jgi:hypothetical protein
MTETTPKYERAYDPGANTSQAMKRLDDWIVEHNARCLYQRKVDGVGWIDVYAVGSSTIHVVRYRRHNRGPFDGWDIYVPAAPQTNRIDETLALVEVAVGIRPAPKPVPDLPSERVITAKVAHEEAFTATECCHAQYDPEHGGCQTCEQPRFEHQLVEPDDALVILAEWACADIAHRQDAHEQRGGESS